MIAGQDISRGILGAWSLLLGNKSAIPLFDNSMSGFKKSFFAALIVSPIYISMRFLDVIGFQSSRSLVSVILIDLEFFVMGWVIWPLFISYIITALDRDKFYIRYVVAYNWAAAVGTMVFSIIAFFCVFSPLPNELLNLILGCASLGILLYHVFVAYVMLEISLAAAVGLTITEFILSKVLFAVQQLVLM